MRQELKQKAKRVVEREWLPVLLRVSDKGPNGRKLTPAAYNEKVQKARDARVNFLKENDVFHHGQIELPDPEEDNAVRVL